MDDSRLVFGIDLGTTYSCVAQVDKFDQAVVLKNFEGRNTTPSVVYFGEDNSVIVGEEARELSKFEPQRTVSFIKRNMGTDGLYIRPTGLPNDLDPSEISAYILKKIVKDANDAGQFSELVKNVVITCPAYFGTKERLRTKQAGEIAGLNVLAVINEPTAAALAYGIKLRDEEKFIMVYDLGGGTFDVTIIRVKDKTTTVIATGGDNHLGGVDWDEVLAYYFLDKYNAENNTSLTLDSDPLLKNELMILAEEKKRALKSRDNVNAVVSYEGASTRVEVSRSVFEQLTEYLLEQTIDRTKEVIEIAKKKGFTRIDEFLLVGGSSRMPQVKNRVDKEFACDAKITDPDECVAKGAAIFGLNESYSTAMEIYLEGDSDVKPQPINSEGVRTRVINVTSKTYGIGCKDLDTGKDVVENLIFANTLLDGNCKAVATFYTTIENQTSILLPIYESDVTDPKTDKVIDLEMAVQMNDRDATIALTKQLPKGTPIQLTLEINEEGILQINIEVAGENIDYKMTILGVRDVDDISQSVQTLANSDIQ